MFEAADPVPAGPGRTDQVLGRAGRARRRPGQRTGPADRARGRARAGRARAEPHDHVRQHQPDDHDQDRSNADGTVRVDGWLAPPHRCRVELTMTAGPITTDGRRRRPVRLPQRAQGHRPYRRPPAGAIGRGEPAGSVRDKDCRYPRARALIGRVSQAERRARQAHRSGAAGGERRAARRRRPAGAGRAGRARLAGRRRRRARSGSGPSPPGWSSRWRTWRPSWGGPTTVCALLAQAEQAADPADRGIVHSQRGLMLMRMGRWADALSQLAAAEPLVGHDPELLARVLLNRSVLHLNTGDVRRATDRPGPVGRHRRGAGLSLTRGQGRPRTWATATCSAATSRPRCSNSTSPPDLPADRARVSPAWTRIRPARCSPAAWPTTRRPALDAAIAAFRRQRRDQHLAEAELARAQAAQAAGDPRWPRGAGRGWRCAGSARRDNHAWAALAELTRLRAAFARPGPRRHRAGGRRARADRPEAA